MNEELIAPCGMNCSICGGYIAFKNDVKNKKRLYRWGGDGND